MRRVQLKDIAVPAGAESVLPAHPPYRSRGEAARLRTSQVLLNAEQYVGTIYVATEETRRLKGAWRVWLTAKDWESVAVPDTRVHLYDSESGEKYLVCVVNACLTRKPRRLEVRPESEEPDSPLALLPVERIVSK